MRRFFQCLRHDRLPYALLLLLSCLLLALLSALTVRRQQFSKPLAPQETPGSAVASDVQERQLFPVHVLGAVAKPGVYMMEEGAIVNDAILAAGGFLEAPPARGLNLAGRLQAHQQIHQPFEGEAPESFVESTALEDGRILLPLNEATVQSLQQLPGVGPSLAQAIVQHRRQLQGFESLEDLLEVPGIGVKRLEQIRPYLRLHPSP